MGSGAQVHVVHRQGDQFRGPQAGLDRRGEQRVVAAAGPGGLVGSGEQRVGLRLAEVGDDRAVEPLGRDGQDPLDDRRVLGMAERGIAEQGVDGGQAGVAGADAVAPNRFQVVQERADQRGIQVGDPEPRRGAARLLLGEGQQELERVAVGGDRVIAGVALPDQPVGEERLQGRGEGAHAMPPGWFSRRSAARASNSGAADKYQLFRRRNNWYLSAAPELLALAAARQDAAWPAARS